MAGRRCGGRSRNIIRDLQRRIAPITAAGYHGVDSITDELRRLHSDYRRLPRASLLSSVSRIVKSASPPSTTASASATTASSSSSESAADSPRMFDLTKSMLRERYGQKRNLEIEITTEKRRRFSASDESEVHLTDAPKQIHTMGNDEVMAVGSGERGPIFDDLGGLEDVLETLMYKVVMPLRFPELPRALGKKPMAGLLLHGPPGCGKTILAHAIANEAGVPFYKISAAEVVSGVSGASEENIRSLFSKASRTAPSIVFIDEIDAIASKRENMQKGMERRIVTQIMTCMDELRERVIQGNVGPDSEPLQPNIGPVIVIGATNEVDEIDRALRRPGRFDWEISLGVPNQSARLNILSKLMQNTRLDKEFDNLSRIARMTSGFVAADLTALVDEARYLAMKRILSKKFSDESGRIRKDWSKQPWDAYEIMSARMTIADLEEAVKIVQPSLRREGFSSIPEVKWEDVGGLKQLREVFKRYVIDPIQNPDKYEEGGITIEDGFLLHGPPGCGKTHIAKAVANASGANFIHIKGPELLSKYVGESESEVRKLFARARTNSPCIIFIDEVDSLTTNRGGEGGYGDRLVNQLLIELDGADNRKGVYVIGATNRLEVIDPAILRPGRLNKLLYVPLPNAEERESILKALARNKPFDKDVRFDEIARRKECENLTGADLAALVKEAAMIAVEDWEGVPSCRRVIQSSHMEQALLKIKPSVSQEQIGYYEHQSRTFQAPSGSKNTRTSILFRGRSKGRRSCRARQHKQILFKM